MAKTVSDLNHLIVRIRELAEKVNDEYSEIAEAFGEFSQPTESHSAACAAMNDLAEILENSELR